MFILHYIFAYIHYGMYNTIASIAYGCALYIINIIRSILIARDHPGVLQHLSKIVNTPLN